MLPVLEKMSSKVDMTDIYFLRNLPLFKFICLDVSTHTLK